MIVRHIGPIWGDVCFVNTFHTGFAHGLTCGLLCSESLASGFKGSAFKLEIPLIIESLFTLSICMKSYTKI